MNPNQPLQRPTWAFGRGQSPNAQTVVGDLNEAYRIRAKMIGVLLRDARQNAGRSVDDCAAVMHVSPAQFEAWELGDDAPSLPQLEIVAYFLGVPVSHFWSASTFEAARDDHSENAQAEYQAIRDRMIGVLLRQAREELGMSLDELSAASGLPAATLEQYELGELALPMSALSALASLLRKNMRYFLETSSYIGDFLALREEWEHFAAMPEDVRRFAANPLHVGFLEIAMQLSQMPADRLRRVGESILNITM